MNIYNFLVAFDSSAPSFEAVEYTASIVRSIPNALITLLFIERLPDKDTFATEREWRAKCTELTTHYKSTFYKAKALLLRNEFDESAISSEYIVSCSSPFEDVTVCSSGQHIADEILSIQKEGNHGTVVVGRRNKTKEEAFLFGSVSADILHEFEDCALWIVSSKCE
ncbi:MAG: universal stress protein [Desulfovibrionales bacterium]|nr:universal stress protein [Desulfovibrionales bacterium]